MKNQSSAYKDWELFRLNLIKATTVEQEDEKEKLKRINSLKKDTEAFFKYYFPDYSYAEPADFHKKATKRLLANKRWYEVRAWSRELAKSVRCMMEVIYLAVTGEIKNVLLISHSKDQAEGLIAPYKINFESNNRLINDYGDFKGLLKWENDHFVTKQGISFKVFGAGQNPRGSRNESFRPDMIIFDDIDTDEEVRSEKRIKDKWNWIEQAVIPSISISRPARLLFLGNIIGKDTCITRAMKQADHSEIINIRDKNGKSSWNKNSEADIEYLCSKMTYRSAQKEYFNNPISEGTVFKQMIWGTIPAIKDFNFLVCYTDPSFKETKKNDYKATFLVGEYKGKYYVVTGYLDQTSTRKMVEWHYKLQEDYGKYTGIYHYMEANFIQDSLLKEFDTYATEIGYMVPIRGDERKKPEKFIRIETLLEPLNNRGNLILNEKEKSNPHMLRLEEQFLSLEPGSTSHDDGPDAIEGAVWIINNKKKVLKGVLTKNKRRGKQRI